MIGRSVNALKLLRWMLQYVSTFVYPRAQDSNVKGSKPKFGCRSRMNRGKSKTQKKLGVSGSKALVERESSCMCLTHHRASRSYLSTYYLRGYVVVVRSPAPVLNHTTRGAYGNSLCDCGRCLPKSVGYDFARRRSHYCLRFQCNERQRQTITQQLVDQFPELKLPLHMSQLHARDAAVASTASYVRGTGHRASHC